MTIIIKNNQLHPLLRIASINICCQRAGVLGGLCLYPTIALISGIHSVAFFTPFCVLTHFTSVRYNYFQSQQLIKSNYPSLIGDYNHFKFKINGDLMLYRKKNNTSKFLMRWFVGHELSMDKKWNGLSRPIGLDIYKYIMKMFNFHDIDKIRIPIYHLRDDIRQDIEDLSRQRRIRFRYPLALGIVSMSLENLVDEILSMDLDEIGGNVRGLGFLCGYLIGLATNPNTTNFYTIKLLDKCDQSIVDSKFENEYKSIEWNNKYVFIDFLGNVVIQRRRSFWRKSRLISSS